MIEAGDVIVATTKGVVVLEEGAATAVGAVPGAPPDWRIRARGLEDRRVTSVIAREGVILAGTTEGVFRSDDGGLRWQPAMVGLGEAHVRRLAFHPEISDFELAGTEPAAIYLSRDGALTWSERPEVATLRERHGWFLPYSPRAGCVRGFAARGDRLWAAIEVGGLLGSEDRGASWRLIAGGEGVPPPERVDSGLHPDVHDVIAPRGVPGLLWAPTGGGLFRSTDDGRSWRRVHPRYTRSIWVDPTDPRHVILSHAAGARARDAALAVSRDGGQTWTEIVGAENEAWQGRLAERFVAPAGSSSLLAVRADGALMAGGPGVDGRSEDRSAWRRVLTQIGYVTDIVLAG